MSLKGDIKDEAKLPPVAVAKARLGTSRHGQLADRKLMGVGHGLLENRDINQQPITNLQ